MSSSNNKLLAKNAPSVGQRPWSTWPNRETMSFGHPQMRNASKRRMDNPYRNESYGPEATTPSEIAALTALRTRLLQPSFMSVNRYRSRMERQARGVPVVSIHGIPILLASGENECKENNEFIRWVQRTRHLVPSNRL